MACGRILIGWQLPNILPSLATNWRRRNNRLPELLRLLLNTLHLLCKGTKPLVQIKAVFELRALSISGYMPNILACANCGTYETPVMYFDVDGGCIYCENCPKAGCRGEPQDGDDRRALHLPDGVGAYFWLCSVAGANGTAGPGDGAVHPAAAGPALYHTGILQVPASRGRDYIAS